MFKTTFTDSPVLIGYCFLYPVHSRTTNSEYDITVYWLYLRLFKSSVNSEVHIWLRVTALDAALTHTVGQGSFWAER